MPDQRRWLTYANVMSTLAVFLVLGGGAALAAGLSKNSVKSKQVKNDSLAAVDLKDGAAVGSAEAIDDSLTGVDINEPSLEIAENAINSARVAADSLTAADLAGNSVGSAEIAPDAVGSSELDLRAVTAENFGGFAAANVNFSTVLAQRCTFRDVDLTNLGANTIGDDLIIASPSTSFSGEFVVSAQPLDGDTARVHVCNNGSGDVDPDGAGSTLRVIAVDFPD